MSEGGRAVENRRNGSERATSGVTADLGAFGLAAIAAWGRRLQRLSAATA